MDQKKDLEKQLAVVSVLVIVSVTLMVRDADGQDGAVEIVNVALMVKQMMMVDQMKELEKRLAVVSVCNHC